MWQAVGNGFVTVPTGSVSISTGGATVQAGGLRVVAAGAVVTGSSVVSGSVSISSSSTSQVITAATSTASTSAVTGKIAIAGFTSTIMELREGNNALFQVRQSADSPIFTVAFHSCDAVFVIIRRTATDLLNNHRQLAYKSPALAVTCP